MNLGVRRLVGRQPVARVTKDFRTLRTLIEALVEQDRFSPDELSGLISDSTSGGFDEWASKMADRASEVEAVNRQLATTQYAIDEEPF